MKFAVNLDSPLSKGLVFAGIPKVFAFPTALKHLTCIATTNPVFIEDLNISITLPDSWLPALPITLFIAVTATKDLKIQLNVFVPREILWEVYTLSDEEAKRVLATLVLENL